MLQGGVCLRGKSGLLSSQPRDRLINQDGRPEAVSGRLRRSALWAASIWGTEGREFKSPQPDKQIPCLNRCFIAVGVSRRIAGVRSGREQAADERKSLPGTVPQGPG